MSVVKFIRLNNWSILPTKEKVTTPEPIPTSIRWLTKERVKGACYPYKMGKQLGWIISSPIDVNISPVEEIQIRGNREDVTEVGRMLGIDFWVQRGETFIGIKPSSWFQILQARVEDNWQGLFIPNGERTFEWRLGWGIEIPDDYFLLIQPLEGEENFIVHPGLLFPKSLEKFNHGLGQGIAFEPKKQHKIRKGDPLARIFVLHNSALEIKDEVIERSDFC